MKKQKICETLGQMIKAESFAISMVKIVVEIYKNCDFFT